MACKIEKVTALNGKDSILYKSLRKRYPESIALTKYLDILSEAEGNVKIYGKDKNGEPSIKADTSPKFKLAEFNSSQDQTDTMDYLAEAIIEDIQTDPTTRDSTTIGGLDYHKFANKAMKLEGSIKRVRERLLNESRNATGDQLKLFKNAILNLPAYIVTERVNASGKPIPMLGKLGRKLKDRGILIGIGEKDGSIVDTLAEELEEMGTPTDIEALEVAYERIYDMDIMQQSVISSVLQGVQIYVRNKPAVAQDMKAGEDIRYDLNAFGTPRPIRYEETMADLFSGLRGIQTVGEMVTKLEGMAKVKPHLLPIYHDVINETATESKVNGKTITYKRITAALFSTFAKQDYNLHTVAETLDGNILVTASNRHTVQAKVQDRWAQNVKNVQKLSEQARNKTSKAIDALLGEGNFVSVANGNYNAVLRRRVSNLLKASGFDQVTPKSLKDLQELFASKNKPKNLKDISYGGALMNILKLVAKPSLKGVDVFVRKGEVKSESKYIKLLANTIAASETDVHLGAFLGAQGNQVNPLNLGSEAQDIVSRLASDEDMRIAFMQDPIYANSQLMKVISNDEDMNSFSVSSFHAINDNTKANAGVKYGDLSTYDALTVRLNGYAESINKRYFRAYGPTQADRGKISAMVVPKLGVTAEGNVVSRLFDGKGRLKDGEIKDWIRFQIEAELRRMADAKANPKKYKNYTEGNATRFNLFTQLNAFIDGTTITTDEIAGTTDLMMEQMDNIFKTIIEGDAAFMVKSGVLGKEGEAFTVKNQRSISKKVTDQGRISKRDMDNFLANNFIYTYEQTLLYAGDPAFYKFDPNSDAVQKVDMNKRMGLPFTPGTKLTVGEEYGIPATAKIKTLNEPKMASEFADVYKALFPNIDKKFYSEIELADGFGIVSMKRFKQVMMSRGKHSQAMLNYIDKLENWDGKSTIDSGGVYLETLKEFYFKLQVRDDIVTPYNLKYSVMPAIPTFFEAKNEDGTYKYPGMAVISQELSSTEESSADEVVMSSAVKVGEVGATDLAGLRTAKAVTIDNDAVRFPQDSTSQDKVEDSFGSQIRKLIASNSNPTGKVTLNGKETTEQVAGDNYQAALEDMVSRLGEEVLAEYIDDQGNLRKDDLLDSILSNIESGIGNIEYYLEAFYVVDGNTVLPMNYPTVKNKVDSMINSSFKQNVTKLKLPGHSAVQVSSLGMEAKKGEFSTDSDLKFVRYSKKGSKIALGKDESIDISKRIKKGEDISGQYDVLPAEIRVAPKFLKNRLKEIAKEEAKKVDIEDSVQTVAKQLRKQHPDMTDGEVFRMTGEYRKFKEQQVADKAYADLTRTYINKDGTFAAEAFEEAGLNDVVLYRIPTQGKNSMLAAKIIGFMPAEFGGTVQVPAEIVDQAGSDFDIDKVYIEATNFELRDGTLQKIEAKLDRYGALDSENSMDQLKSYIQEYHKAILSSTNHIQELLIPNSTKTLDGIIESFGQNDEMYTGNWASMELQETFRSNNKAGKDMISISSVASVAHAIAPAIDTHIIGTLEINGKPFTLGQEYGYDNLLRISDEIGEIQNAALDNSKDPKLGKLNIDDFTASAVMLMVSGGHGLEFATTIVNDPAIRRLAKAYPKFTRKFSTEVAYRKAKKEVRDHYGIRGKAGAAVTPLKGYSLNQAEFTRTDESTSSRIVALSVFDQLKRHGDNLAKTQRALNFDSKGTPSTTHGLVKKALDIASVPGTLSYEQNIVSKNTSLGELGLFKAEVVKKNAKFGVDKTKYAEHSLSAFEENTILKPLKVNRKVSPGASKYGQALIKEAGKMGYLSENQYTVMFAEFDTFLAQNSIANQKSVSGISESMANREHLKLTDPASEDSTANLLDVYRKSIPENGKENKFTANLTVVSQGGREFVTFKNAIARNLTGDAQSDLMFHYEELMTSNDPAQRSLARSLTEYAITHYGYSHSLNSYMALIPPAAHTSFMKAKGKPMTEHFRDLEGTYDDMNENFVEPSTFIDMFVQNNWDKLPVDRAPTKTEDGEGGLTALIPDDPDQKPPAYAVDFKKGKPQLYKWNIQQGKYEFLGIRGIRGYVKEYQNGDTVFNSDGSLLVPNTEPAKNKATVVQKGNVLNMTTAMADISAFLGDALEADNSTFGAATKQANIIANRIESLVGESLFTERFKRLPQQAQKSYDNSVKYGTLRGKTFKSIFDTFMKWEITDSLVSQPFFKNLIKKIQEC